MDDYVLVPKANAVEICDENALEASCEITMHGGYSEAVAAVQRFLDSRLDSYGYFQQMIADQDLRPSLIESPTDLRGPFHPESNRANRESTSSHAADEIDNEVTKKIRENLRNYQAKGLGWSRVPQVEGHSLSLLKQLETEGVFYHPQQQTYGVKYYCPVAPLGDCLFLSVEQLMLSSTEGFTNTAPWQIRELAVATFWNNYLSSPVEERQKIDLAIKNLYHPNLTRGWGVSQMQTRRFLAKKSKRDELLSRILQLEERGLTRYAAAEAVYSQLARRVDCAEAYCEYMRIGPKYDKRRAGTKGQPISTLNGQNHTDSEFYLVSMHYSASGLVSVDDDPEYRRVAWGDDIVLEALACAYDRDIFVVLVGGGKMFFLPHRPRRLRRRNSTTSNGPSTAGGELIRQNSFNTMLGKSQKEREANVVRSHYSLDKSPWFLLMRSTGVERGGDHYEPMLNAVLEGGPAACLGSIGE